MTPSQMIVMLDLLTDMLENSLGSDVLWETLLMDDREVDASKMQKNLTAILKSLLVARKNPTKAQWSKMAARVKKMATAGQWPSDGSDWLFQRAMLALENKE